MGQDHPSHQIAHYYRQSCMVTNSCNNVCNFMVYVTELQYNTKHWKEHINLSQ
jgi:hypothetical protein